MNLSNLILLEATYPSRVAPSCITLFSIDRNGMFQSSSCTVVPDGSHALEEIDFKKTIQGIKIGRNRPLWMEVPTLGRTRKLVLIFNKRFILPLRLLMRLVSR